MNFFDAEVACDNMPGPGIWRLLQPLDLNDPGVSCDTQCINPFGLFWIGSRLSMPALRPLFSSESHDISLWKDELEVFEAIGDGQKEIMDDVQFTAKFQY